MILSYSNFFKNVFNWNYFNAGKFKRTYLILSYSNCFKMFLTESTSMQGSLKLLTWSQNTFMFCFSKHMLKQDSLKSLTWSQTVLCSSFVLFSTSYLFHSINHLKRSFDISDLSHGSCLNLAVQLKSSYDSIAQWVKTVFSFSVSQIIPSPTDTSTLHFETAFTFIMSLPNQNKQNQNPSSS